MKRSLYQQLVDWKSGADRKPLLLQGGRQVGKTYVIREFGRREYADTAYLDFERTPALGSLFDSSLEPRSLIPSLSAAVGIDVNRK